jgi:hypothetical protein
MVAAVLSDLVSPHSIPKILSSLSFPLFPSEKVFFKKKSIPRFSSLSFPLLSIRKRFFLIHGESAHTFTRS